MSEVTHQSELRRLAEHHWRDKLRRTADYIDELEAENAELVKQADRLHYQLAVALGWQPFPYVMPGEPSGEQLWCPPGDRVHISTAIKLPITEIVRQVAALRKCVALYADKDHWSLAYATHNLWWKNANGYEPAQECLEKLKGRYEQQN